MKKVYLANTGGTIGMRKTAVGYAPEPGYLAQLLADLPELMLPGMPDITLHEFSPLLDSANITPDLWSVIACDIADHYREYDGFVILHGTDTMAYTSSALAFMLEGLAKPVILTGSQLPLCEIRSDGRENLITSLLIAANYSIPEVCLYFGNHLLRGCRAVKVNAFDFEAFTSPNFPPLGVAGIDIQINTDLVRPIPSETGGLVVQALHQPVVGALRLFPGITAGFLNNILQSPVQGLVLEAYGVGNGPDRDQDFLAALEKATRRGIVVIVCTQCLHGQVQLGDYATGSALAQAGAIGGADLTVEAALTKLLYLFSKGLSPDIVKTEMLKNIRGELTPTR